MALLCFDRSSVFHGSCSNCSVWGVDGHFTLWEDENVWCKGEEGSCRALWLCVQRTGCTRSVADTRLPAKFKLSAVKGEGLPQLPVLIHIPNSIPFSFRLWDPDMVDVAKKESTEYTRIFSAAAGMCRPWYGIYRQNHQAEETKELITPFFSSKAYFAE